MCPRPGRFTFGSSELDPLWLTSPGQVAWADASANDAKAASNRLSDPHQIVGLRGSDGEDFSWPVRARNADGSFLGLRFPAMKTGGARWPFRIVRRRRSRIEVPEHGAEMAALERAVSGTQTQRTGSHGRR